MPTINTADGATISFTDKGAGIPILFLHGWLMSKKAWHYQQQLSSEFRVITMDLRGHGRSDAFEFSYSDCISDINALVDYLDIENIFIVGWSMGSQLAILSSLELDERVSGLILVAGTPRFSNCDGYTGGLPPEEARGMKVRIRRDYQSTSAQFFQSMFSESETADSDLKAIAANTTTGLPPLEIALSALKELTESDLRPLLSEIKKPALLIHGKDDSICPAAASEFIGTMLPQATLVLLDSAGHAPFMTQPDRFNREVSCFLRRVNGGD